MSNIVLVGTVHVDHRGPERLEKVLNRYKPSIICLEQTPKSATKGWRGHLDLVKKLEETHLDRVFSPEQIERVRLELMSSYYESWVPKVYKNGSSDITLYCIDRDFSTEFHDTVDATQRVWVMRELANGKSIQDLITPVDVEIMDFVKNGSIEKHQAHVDREYDKTDSNVLISIYGQGVFNAVVLERDKRFAEQIRKIHEDNPNKVLVATFGNNHIFGDYSGNTYNLLSDLNPARLKLKDADRL
jgi:pheromone shutdown protein TraB